MHRSEITIDLGAIRHNARRLLDALDGAELWAVVKADGYGHGAVDIGRAALEAGASVLCVAAVDEGLELRRELPEARILVMGPTRARSREAREARLELTVPRDGEIPATIPVHLKLDSGMGRWGLAELARAARERRRSDDASRDRRQRPRIRANTRSSVSGSTTAPYAAPHAPAANSAAALRSPRRTSTRRVAASRSTASRRSTPIRLTTAYDPRSPGRAISRRFASSRPARAPATDAASSPSDRRGSASSRSATQTASGAT